MPFVHLQWHYKGSKETCGISGLAMGCITGKFICWLGVEQRMLRRLVNTSCHTQQSRDREFRNKEDLLMKQPLQEARLSLLHASALPPSFSSKGERTDWHRGRPDRQPAVAEGSQHTRQQHPDTCRAPRPQPARAITHLTPTWQHTKPAAVERRGGRDQRAATCRLPFPSLLFFPPQGPES